MADKYKLVRDYECPLGRTLKGTVKKAEDWVRQFKLIDKDDLDIKTDWFEKIDEDLLSIKPRLYTEEEMRKCYERGWICGGVAAQGPINKEYSLFETFISELQSKDR